LDRKPNYFNNIGNYLFSYAIHIKNFDNNGGKRIV